MKSQWQVGQETQGVGATAGVAERKQLPRNEQQLLQGMLYTR